MRIRMRITQAGSIDGIEVRIYEVGEAYDLPDPLASVFLREGWAEQDKSLDGPHKTKTEIPHVRKRSRK